MAAPIEQREEAAPAHIVNPMPFHRGAYRA
jgi:hypothetical protein